MAVYPPLTKTEAMSVIRRSAWQDYDGLSEARYGCETLAKRTDVPEEVRAAAEAVMAHLDSTCRHMVHAIAGFGCDMPVEDVHEWIKEAQEVRWADSLFGPSIAILRPNGKWAAVDTIASHLVPEGGEFS